MTWHRSAVPTSYDQAATTVDPRWHGTPWQAGDLAAELAARLATQVDADQVVVDHYRVGHRWAFPVPVADRPAGLPTAVGSLQHYPWLIWLTWELTERWDVLAGAWRTGADDRAGQVLQRDLAALAGWPHFRNWRDEVGLPTGHLAMALARGLALPGWDARWRADAERAGRRLLDGDVGDWFTRTWLRDAPLHNIPMIVLCSVAALAAQLDHPDAGRYRERAVTAVEDWFTARERDRHTEQTAYNGYLFDAVTQWMELDRAAGGDLVERWEAPLTALCPEWVHSTVPGRADLAVPLGDVEAEMTMWLSCVTRLCEWYGDAATAGAGWLVHRCAPQRLPADALLRCLAGAVDTTPAPEPPATGPQELPAAVAVRHGWGPDDPAVVVGLARVPVGHLHRDAGQVVLAWRGACWVTDPGYQQYRQGPERNYSIGPTAHNAPVVDGHVQTRQECRLLGTEPVEVDLSPAYPGLPDGAVVRRTVTLRDDRLVVDDEVTGAGHRVDTHWLAGARLAWALVDGWIRWTDGTAALWCGTGTGPDADDRDRFDPDGVQRHEGSRGPVGLRHSWSAGRRRWQFVWDRSGGWQPPRW